ncbi:MAG: nickel pincer cofactor biosynthesis protein LarB [Pseudomonadota bacterium]
MRAIIDWDRTARTGTAEAILCDGKRVADIEAILDAAAERSLFLTRLTSDAFASLSARHQASLDYDPLSKTAIYGPLPLLTRPATVAIVAAGLADAAVAQEAARALRFQGEETTLVGDVGVAGLWRLMDRLDDIMAHKVVIVVAGMEGALFSVLAGLIDAPIIAVPTSNGYGVATGGRAALSTALATCAPGVVTVNIDNGFGAAAAAQRILRLIDRSA